MQFVGYDPHVVRYLGVLLFRFLCRHRGRARGYQFRDRQFSLSWRRAVGNACLFAAYIGGVGFFIGPIVGAIFVTLLSLGLSDLTSVWQLYFGLIFIAVVVFAPGGITGLLMMHRPLFKGGTFGKVLPVLSDRVHSDARLGHLVSFLRSKLSCITP